MPLKPAHLQRLKELQASLDQNKWPGFDVDAMHDLDSIGWTKDRWELLEEFLSRYPGPEFLSPADYERWRYEQDSKIGEDFDAAEHHLTPQDRSLEIFSGDEK